VFSRRVMGARAHVQAQAGGTSASALLLWSVRKVNCRNACLVHHANNGDPVKSFTMQEKPCARAVVQSSSCE